ncbi:hypothetical protein D3C81_1971480 [compost metagenome]
MVSSVRTWLYSWNWSGRSGSDRTDTISRELKKWLMAWSATFSVSSTPSWVWRRLNAFCSLTFIRTTWADLPYEIIPRSKTGRDARIKQNTNNFI